MPVIYDSLNNLVWVQGQRSAGPQTSTKFYGKDARTFKNNTQARAYAIRLGKEKGLKVYDKYYGKYIKSPARKKITRRSMSWF